MLRTNFRRGQYLLVTSANVAVNSGANTPNFSLSCTGPMMSLRMQGSMTIMQMQASGAPSGLWVVNLTYSAGYIYGSILTSDAGVVTTSATQGINLMALVASR